MSEENDFTAQDYQGPDNGTDEWLDGPDCEICDDTGCEQCDPEHFTETHLKWVCDDAVTIEDAISNLKAFINELEDYKKRGFVLTDPVENSHFFLSRPDN